MDLCWFQFSLYLHWLGSILFKDNPTCADFCLVYMYICSISFKSNPKTSTSIGVSSVRLCNKKMVQWVSFSLYLLSRTFWTLTSIFNPGWVDHRAILVWNKVWPLLSIEPWPQSCQTITLILVSVDCQFVNEWITYLRPFHRCLRMVSCVQFCVKVK